jgi:putative FmdB family regulatory protein
LASDLSNTGGEVPMPIYEYACCECGHQFEWLVRGSEKPSCPACGRDNLTKKLSVPAAHVASPSANSCPVKESCGVPNCCGKGCGIGEWF